MIKRGITTKLTIGFIIVVLISMLTIGVIFIQMFRGFVFQDKQNVMLDRAREIASVTSQYISGGGNMMRGFGMYVKLLDTLAGAKVWITDTNGIVVLSSGNMGNMQNQSVMPEEAKKVIKNVISGKESIGESFSSIYNEATLTVGVPIYDSDKSIVGAVFLHAPVTGITETLYKAIYILLVGIVIAVIIALLLGVFYSAKFTKPLKTINKLALEMANGNYSVRTDIQQQDEIGQLGESFNIMASKLGNTLDQLYLQEKQRKDFVANVSHELRTPLTLIRGSIEAIIDGTIKENEEIQNYNNRILKETISLERLVKELLDLSKLESGKLNLNLEKIDLYSITRDVVKAISTLSNYKNIKINIEAPEEIPMVMGDYDRLRQVLVIILDNAIKYSPNNTNISITFIKDKYFNVIIKDEGYGIQKEDLPFVWDRFYMADKSRSKTDKGTGLGLSIAKLIVELHHGNISIESEYEKGTKVEFGLPIIY